jgi:hypothetical protein
MRTAMPTGPRKPEIDMATSALAAKLIKLNSLKLRFVVIVDYTDGMDRRLKTWLDTRRNAGRIQDRAVAPKRVSEVEPDAAVVPSGSWVFFATSGPADCMRR